MSRFLLAAVVYGGLALGCGQSGEEQADQDSPPANAGQPMPGGPMPMPGGPTPGGPMPGGSGPARAAVGGPAPASSNPTTNFFTTLDRAAKGGGAQR